MNEKLLIRAMEIFDTSEKWNSFQELMNLNNNIQNSWWRKMQTEVYQRELKEHNPDWDIKKWNQWDLEWYIKGGDENALMVHYWGLTLRVCFNEKSLDPIKVQEIIKDEKFNAITDCFERVDGRDRLTIGWENGNFSFGTSFDGRFPNDVMLSWFAGNETEKFADQLIEKVRKFQTPEITELFKEINNVCKR